MKKRSALLALPYLTLPLFIFLSACYPWMYGYTKPRAQNQYLKIDTTNNNFGSKRFSLIQKYYGSPIKTFVKQNGIPDYLYEFFEEGRDGFIFYYIPSNRACIFKKRSWRLDSIYLVQTRNINEVEKKRFEIADVKGIGITNTRDKVAVTEAETLKCLILQADQGSEISQFQLGSMYYTGHGVPQDYKEAIKWYKMAAEQGNTKAQFLLGNIYHSGEHAPQDYKEAIKWLKQAAEHGFGAAQVELALMYLQGQGVPQDYIKAYAWLNLGVAQGLEFARGSRDDLSRKMSPQQLSKAQELTAQLVQKIEGSANESQSTTTNKDKRQIKFIGTGFIITRDGYVITCYHVIDGAELIEVQIAEKSYQATLVLNDQYNDLALLKISGDFHALAFSDQRSAQMGEEVFTIGFPNPIMQGVNAKLTKGEVSSLTGYRDDLRLYQVSVPIQPGNSGGPLVDMKGNVKGIIVAVLDAKAAFNITGEIPQNVNYAVKSTYALALLDSLPEVCKRMPAPKIEGIPFDNVVNHAKECTVMVIAY
jgi:TPR repeat protein